MSSVSSWFISLLRPPVSVVNHPETMFADRLLDAIDAKGSPICVGIDPVYELLPDAVAGPAADRDANDAEAALDAIFAFTTGVLRTVAPLVPVVKFQSAYFERFLWDGVEAYYSLIAEAKDLGLLVIGDVKRGDIGSTSAAYAAAHLADVALEATEAATPDAITVNPMLGLDAIEPFVPAARAEEQGAVRAGPHEQPGVGRLPGRDAGRRADVVGAGGGQAGPVADDPALVGRRGASSLGAVVGATQAHTMASLRRRLPRSPFLLPGYGTQGATAEMTRAAFAGGAPALVSASRSILYPKAVRRRLARRTCWRPRGPCGPTWPPCGDPAGAGRVRSARMFRRLAWSLAWGSAAAGVVVVVAAWRCRSEVRLVAVHSPAACVNWRVSARDLELEGWPTREYEWSGYGDSPARVFGHVSVTTGTAPRCRRSRRRPPLRRRERMVAAVRRARRLRRPGR